MADTMALICDTCGYTEWYDESVAASMADFKNCPIMNCTGVMRWRGHDRDLPNGSGETVADIATIVSPDAPMTENSQGGRQSDIPVRFDLIDAKAMFEMAKVLHTGAVKYGEDNWRKIDVNDHLNHLLMHTFAYLAGDTTDDHLSHILCRATFALGVKLGE